MIGNQQWHNKTRALRAAAQVEIEAYFLSQPMAKYSFDYQ
jgi:hypothetical protein